MDPPLIVTQSHGLRILCIDGGGIRGLSALMLLEIIMMQVSSRDSPDVPRPCDVFDLICGTSTGGLIALMLGRLGMSIREAIIQYEELTQLLFPNERWFAQLRSLGSYDISILEDWVTNMVKKVTGNPDAPLCDPAQSCRTFVVALRAEAQDTPTILRSYSAPWGSDIKCTIKEAACATAAVAPFFDPVTIGNPPLTFIDQSFSEVNNPSMVACYEISRLFDKPKIACFLSLGTGIAYNVSIDGCVNHLVKAYARLVKSCELVHGKIMLERHVKDHAYFRFSVERTRGPVPFNEWNRSSKLNAITFGYMCYQEQLARSERCIALLQAASADGNEAAVELLLSNVTHIDTQGERFCAVLDAASAAGHNMLFRLLLDMRGAQGRIWAPKRSN